MDLNGLILKISKHNIKRYLVYAIAIVFATAMLGGYAVLLFSKTISEVLIIGGSTFVMALALFSIMLVGMVFFMVYANYVYLKSKMNEIGILLSLGLEYRNILKIVNKEFSIIFFASAFIGELLSVPVASLGWSILATFSTNVEAKFKFGWYGLGINIVIIFFMWILLRLINRRQIQKTDIIDIMKVSASNEPVVENKPFLGILGIICVPLGVFIFRYFDAYTGILGKTSILYLGISLFGLYIIASQITGIGSFAKKLKEEWYYNNLLYFNLVKQKGKQYTLSIFITAILVAMAIFAVIINIGIMIDAVNQTSGSPYDFSLYTNYQTREIDEKVIEELAVQEGLEISEFTKIDLLHVGRLHQRNDGLPNEWAGDILISNSDFNTLTGQNVIVANDEYLAYSDDSHGAFDLTCTEDVGEFYNPSTKEDFYLKKQGFYLGDYDMNRGDATSSFIVINDDRYSVLSQELEKEFHAAYYLFNGTNNEIEFQEALLVAIITACDGIIYDNFNILPVKDKYVTLENDIFVAYEGNEMYAARNWDLYPFSKATAIDIMMESGIVYILLFFFIAVVTFISATMIIGLKAFTSISQDYSNYLKAAFLGFKEKNVKDTVTKQLLLVFFAPSVLGGVTAIICINGFLKATELIYDTRLMWYTLAAGVIVCAIQAIVFLPLRGQIIKATLDKMEIYTMD